MGSVIKKVLVYGAIIVTLTSVVIAAGCVTYFVILGKGVNIDRSSHSTSTSNSYANSGALSIGYIGGDYRGNWEIAEFDCNSAGNLYELLRSLDPVQFLAAKVVRYSDSSFKVYFPKIVSTSVEDRKVKKIVNGVEIK